MIFKHLKSLKTSPDLPAVMIKDGYPTKISQEKTGLLIEFFRSVYSPKTILDINNFNSANPAHTILDVFRDEIAEILLWLSKSKSRGPNSYPHIVLRKLALHMIK